MRKNQQTRERFVVLVTVVFVVVFILSAGVAAADAHCAATPTAPGDVVAEPDASLEITDPTDEDTNAVVVTDGDVGDINPEEAGSEAAETVDVTDLLGTTSHRTLNESVLGWNY